MVTICLACRGDKTKILRRIQSKYCNKIMFIKNKNELETAILEIFKKEWENEQRRIYEYGNEDITRSEIR